MLIALCVATVATALSAAPAGDNLAKSATATKDASKEATKVPVTKSPSPATKAPAPVIPTPPQVEAGAWILMNAYTGQVYAESNADQRLEPASLTKIMTAYVVFDALRSGDKTYEDQVRISERSWKTGGSRTFLKVGTQVPLEIVLKGMIIQSGNDASVALAEHLAGTEPAFAQLMNHHASQLGMVNSHFENATGLPITNHYSSARDLAILARHLIERFPDYYKLFSVKEFSYNNIIQHNRDVLLSRDDAVDGIKTGYTERAGYCLVSSAEREGMRLISVVLNTKSPAARARETLALLAYGFHWYETQRLYTAGNPVTEVKVWKGATQQLALGTAKDVRVTTPRGQGKNVATAIEVQPRIVAPVTKGQVLGTVRVTLPDGTVEEHPLVALTDIAEGSWWRRMLDAVLMWFQKG